ncbi:MAG TPA: choice-of-anchor D domain-containing protein [Candidatus Didemnitutus sp.]|nr:choice-of-anchor D domain-containing protein [Candidatus Didemnitutus sp.]
MIMRYTSRTLFVIALFVVTALSATAQKKVPSAEQMLNSTGALGTDFWIAIPPNEVNPFPVNQLEVYVASAFDTEITVFDASGDKTYRRQVKAMEIRTLSDARGETNWTWEIRESEQVVRKGVRITSKKPISVYVINSKTTTSDGYLAIPVSGWGREYVATSYYDFRESRAWGGGFVIVGGEQGTIVEISLRGVGELDAKTAGGKRIGDPPFQVTLNDGEVYMVKGDATTRGTFDLTGSKITSDKPIGIISFHERTTMPNLLVNGNGRNHLVEMTPPVTAWGKKYVTVEYNREHLNGQGVGDVFRVVAKEPNTKWSLKYYNKANGSVMGQGGGVLGKAGEFADLTQAGAPTNITQGFSVWTADKPIFVMQYSCSSTWDGDPILDPFMINVTPEEQFLTSTIFQFPTAAKWGKHRLNLIVKVDTTSPTYIDDLKSLVIDGVPVYQHPTAVSPKLLSTKMPNGLFWASLDFGPSAAAHRISGNGEVSFGGYIYGYGEFDAYGWPAAAGFRPTGFVDTMPPVIKGDSLCGDYTFEATELRNIPDPPATVIKDTDQVETGIAMIDTVPGSNSYNYELVLETAQTFPADPSYKRFKYQWNVIDKSKDAYCVYFVRDFYDNVTFDTCWYFADRISFSPNPLDFGKIRLGTSKAMDVTITNNSDAEVQLKISDIMLGTYFTITGGAVPPDVIIPARGSHTIQITYSGARETGDVRTDWDKDTLTIGTACGFFKHPLTGVAAVPRISVEDFVAGTASLNEERCKTGGLKISNPGSDTLVITSMSGFNGTNFSVSNPTTPPLPLSIPPKGSINLEKICYKSATITVDNIDVTFSNNGDGPDSVSNWTGQTQSPGPNITGYDWKERRIGSVFQSICYVYNTGNEVLKLRDVTFTDGTKYYPAGSNDANYIFKIAAVLNNGAPLTGSMDLSGRDTVALDSAEVIVLFRPDGERVFDDPIIPVWEGKGDTVQAELRGEGIIPKIDTDPVNLTCIETPEGTPVRRTITITNAGSMPLTVSGLALKAPVAPGYAIIAPPATPFVVAPSGGTQVITVEYTRPTLYLGASVGTLVVTHDATPGNGIDSTTLTPVQPLEETVTVASCSEPDISTGDRDFGRQLANCDSPISTFPITNPSGSNKPLEVRDIIETGADTNAFAIVRILDENGTPTSLPLTILAGRTYNVEVQFTPTEPNATPWVDRPYSVQYEITGYGQGNAAPLKTVTANIRGIGYVVPVRFDLTNDIPAGGTKEPGTIVSFNVNGSSALWANGDVTSFIADVIYDTKNLEYTNGSVTIGSSLAGGWTVNDPVITQINPTQSQMRFTGTGGTRIVTDGPIFSFKTTLLLADKFSSPQDLVLTLSRPCLVPSATGDSTAIFNCALTRRVVSISGTQANLAPVAPNPVSSGTARVVFGVGITSETALDLVNAQGSVVKTFVNTRLQDGEYEMTFSTQGLASGVYFLRMRTAAYTASQQVLIVD